MTAFPERDNRGKVHLHFCPDDITVALDDGYGIGTGQVISNRPPGCPCVGPNTS
ncbi:hypothetical protein [Pseudomonas sp.]|uniref:hypothetical protein n=1 Tax=Pseudomonas sp. TaxID=306 RepID=UPI0028A7B45B|nr:hypothetical protein [Pseudomonas sp.]